MRFGPKDVLYEIEKRVLAAGFGLVRGEQESSVELDSRQILRIIHVFRTTLYTAEVVDPFGVVVGGGRYIRFSAHDRARFEMMDLERAVRLSAVRCGVLDPDELPSNALLATIVAELAEVDPASLRPASDAPRGIVSESKRLMSGACPRCKALDLVWAAASIDLDPEAIPLDLYLSCLRARSVVEGSRIGPIPSQPRLHVEGEPMDGATPAITLR